MSDKGWIGVDFDGTLAQYSGWVDSEHTGAPVPEMVRRVRQWMAMGAEVRIFTARIFPLNRCIWPDDKRVEGGTYVETSREDDAWRSIKAIRVFCNAYLGQPLPITNVKDFGMVMLYDDRCTQVITNTGELIEAANA